MFPYGFIPGDWKSEDWGPSTKHHKLSSKNRSSWRRAMHKNARNKGKREITKMLDEYKNKQ